MAGLYVHIPFCTKKCIYCDFYSIENLNPIAGFLNALHQEIQLSIPQGAGTSFSTVFLGGGTPSLLPPEDIAAILDHLHRAFSIDADAEVTMESNPGTLELTRLRGYRAAGVNRLSIGVQSFHEDELAFLGRIHNAEEAEQAVHNAREAGFTNVSIDLIYSLPGQSIAKWGQSLTRALALQTNHISAYSLIVEDNTPLARLVGSRQVVPQPAEREAEFFEHTSMVLASAGYEQYEVSNFAQPGFRSSHNMNYWRHGNYLGLGPSAHSFWKMDGEARRWWNIANVNNYISLLADGSLPTAGDETLTGESMMVERFFLGLRSDGVRLDEFRREFGDGLLSKHRSLLHELVRDEMMVMDENTIRLTPKGYLLCDEMSARLTN